MALAPGVESMTNSERRNEPLLDSWSFDHSGIPSSFNASPARTIRASSFFSFVTQRFNWIEGGGFARRVKSKKNSDGRANEKCDYYRAG